ncbi:MAG: deoxyribose-phosphate aldolase [Actinomycetota bacterium]|nr:deoxyribose-phosphate aldolase [Actinomycetota bacterium]
MDAFPTEEALDYSIPPRGQLTEAQVAAMIDHSLLRPELTLDDVTAGCEIAATHDVASVCCKPSDVVHAGRLLAGTRVLVGTVVGFPHGSSTTATKVFEARRALDEGARELDMVINIGRLRGGQREEVADDIRAIVDVAATTGALVKVIFENAYLTDDEVVLACRLTEEAGADFVKTSTGFASTGATMEHLRLMRRSVGPKMQVKAAGGVRTLDTLLEMVAIGVSRFGATATVAMLADAKARAAIGELVVPPTPPPSPSFP